MACVLLALVFLLTKPRVVRASARDLQPSLIVLTPPEVPSISVAPPSVQRGPSLERFLGRPVAGIDVSIRTEGPSVWWDVPPPVLAPVAPGTVLSAALVRRALHDVLAGGAFGDADADVVDEGGRVRIVVRVTPRRVVDSVRMEFEGSASGLEAGALLRELGVGEESELTLGDLGRVSARLEAILKRHGFPLARVAIATAAAEQPLRIALTLSVSLGAPRKLERRVLYAADATQEEIAQAERAYTVAVGMRADEAMLSAADDGLEAWLKSRGYHKAQVSHDVVLYGGVVTLRVRADFGLRFETKYEGNDHFDRTTLDGVLELESETDRTPNHLASKLTEFYGKRGFLDVRVRVEVHSHPPTGLTQLLFFVDEGARVTVAERIYPCVSADDIKRLSSGGPPTIEAIASEIDSFLDEELPGGEVIGPPDPASVDRMIAGGVSATGARPAPFALEPRSVFVPETYERAAQHVQELYRSEGFLSAQVGPVQVLRRACDPRSPAGECRPLTRRDEAGHEEADVCAVDGSGLPRPVPPLDPSEACVADPMRGVACEPRVRVRIPIKLGPRTQLWDVSFVNAVSIAPSKLATAAQLELGRYASSVKLEEARRRVLDAYKEEGFAFADVKYTLEESPDHTRARARFTVFEGERVIVSNILLRGNVYTNEGTIRNRIALVVGQPYRASLVRQTEERIATLGVFSSVTISLDNPYVPQGKKTVLVTMVERPRQYTEFAPGFSTGEGFRLRGEYGHTNLAGRAVQLTLRLQLAYIPTPLIIDPVARSNYRDLGDLARLGVRATAGVVFPEVGLGPRVTAGVDTVVVHDLQRDFFLTKVAAIPSVTYRSSSEFQVSLFPSVEFNNSRIFQSGSANEYLTALLRQGLTITDIVRQLLVPDGETYAVAQRVFITWDRRDNAFNASRGTYVVTGVEHVDAYPTDANLERSRVRGLPAPPESHFVKLTQTFGGYIPLPKGLRLASLTRVGINVQLTDTSQTYPDRLFFMGGVDTMRGWTLNSFIPQDNVDRIFATRDLPDEVPDPSAPGQVIPNASKFTPSTQPIRGGNLMANQRIELRIPILGKLETVLFSDIGNLWTDPRYPFLKKAFPMRVAVGSGLRVQTPVGPLAVDYGFNVTRETYEDPGALNFAIGLF